MSKSTSVLCLAVACSGMGVILTLMGTQHPLDRFVALLFGAIGLLYAGIATIMVIRGR